MRKDIRPISFVLIQTPMFPVCWDRAPSVKKPFIWSPGVPIETQVAILCQYLAIQGPAEEHCASVNDRVLTDEDMKGNNLPPDLVVIQIKPDIQARQMIAALASSPMERKKALFEVGKLLQVRKLIAQFQSATFARAFLRLGGMKNLSSLVQEETGNSLAYALTAMDTAMECKTFI